MRTLTDVRIPIADGAQLAADVYLPNDDRPVPALLAYMPYGKELQMSKTPPQDVWEPFWCGTIEAGDIPKIVERGYAHIVLDARGTGHSDGIYRNMFSVQEQDDGYHAVEWIAEQDWCDGNVGMFGTSYLAIIQYLVAAKHPPHLKAICPFRGAGDIYRDAVYHGGVLELGFYNPYFWSLIDINAPVEPGTPVEEIEDKVKVALANPNLTTNPYLYGILLNWKRNPLLFDYLINPHDSEFYQQRSPYSVYHDVDIPTLIGATWTDTVLHLPGAFSAYSGITAQKKLIVGPLQPKRPFVEYHDVMLRWFDHWLKGIDTGMLEDPPILIFCGGQNEWRWEQEWPLDRTQWTQYYLHADSKLDTVPPTTEPAAPRAFTQAPPQTPAGRQLQSLQYETEPLSEALEITGPIAMKLYAAIDREDTNFIVRLYNVDPDGNAFELTQGFLRASHREVDPERGGTGAPWHPHTAESVSLLTPGTVYAFDILLQPTSHLLRAGHRVRIELSSSDFAGTYCGMTTLFHHLPDVEEVTHSVHCSPAHPSHILLPVIPGDGVDRAYDGPDPRA
jgi:predicted acyl esterase